MLGNLITLARVYATLIAWFTFIILIAAAASAQEVEEYEPYVITVATVSYEGIPQKAMSIRGPIMPGISADVKEMLLKHDDIDVVFLSSPGGAANEGYRLAGIMSDNGLRTVVERGRYCLSACAIAFMGGTDYKIRGVLGFHNAWTTDQSLEGFGKAFNDAQQIGAYWFQFVTQNGFAADLAWEVLNKTSPSTFLIFLNEYDFISYMVTDRESFYEYFTVGSNEAVAADASFFFPNIVGPQIEAEIADPTISAIEILDRKESIKDESGQEQGDSAS